MRRNLLLTLIFILFTGCANPFGLGRSANGDRATSDPVTTTEETQAAGVIEPPPSQFDAVTYSGGGG